MKENNCLKNLALITGFITLVAAIASGVYAVIKYFDKKQEEEFMDYYFDDSDFDDDDIEDQDTQEESEETDEVDEKTTEADETEQAE